MTSSVEKKISRYVQGGETTTYTNRLGWWERYDLSQGDDDIVFTLDAEYHQRPDKVAYKLYGRASLVWLVLQYNNIVDVEEEFVSGKKIRLPAVDRVMFDMLNKPVGGTPANNI